jgi:hypothetical protein
MTNWDDLDRFLIAKGLRIGPPKHSQTTGGRHTIAVKNGNLRISSHYLGNARDYGGSDSDILGIVKTLEPIALQPNGPIAELFCAVPPWAGIFIKNGKRFSPGSELLDTHRDHCHVALRPVGQLL